MSLEEIT